MTCLPLRRRNLSGGSCPASERLFATPLCGYLLLHATPGPNCTQQEIKHTGTPETEESYAITAHLDKNVQINITFTKPADAPGAKYGTGEQAGYSNFGSNDPTKRDAFVIQ